MKIFKLENKSTVGYDSRWILKSNFPPDNKLNAENLGKLYGAGTYVIAEKITEITVVERSTFVEGAKK